MRICTKETDLKPDTLSTETYGNIYIKETDLKPDTLSTKTYGNICKGNRPTT